MEIKYGKDEKGMTVIEIPDECSDLMKTPEGFHQVMEDIKNSKIEVMKEFFSSLTSLGVHILNEYMNYNNKNDSVLTQD